MTFDTLDGFVASAEAMVEDLLLVAGLAARRPFHILGGDAIVVHDGSDGRRYESVEFTRSRRRHPVSGRRSFNDVHIEQDRFLRFLESAMQVLATDPRADFIRLAIRTYAASMYRAFDTQQFLSTCTAIEALKEWHSRNEGWHKLVSRRKQSAISNLVRRALTEAAMEGHLVGKAHTEAREKIPELFRPRISTVLNELVAKTQIDVEDLFNRKTGTGPRGPYDFDFLSVRNKLVHQGKPPSDPDAFHNVTVRTRYFVERLLFTVLGYPPRGFLKLQYKVKKPDPR